jgi:hypothetical protein
LSPTTERRHRIVVIGRFEIVLLLMLGAPFADAETASASTPNGSKLPTLPPEDQTGSTFRRRGSASSSKPETRRDP